MDIHYILSDPFPDFIGWDDNGKVKRKTDEHLGMLMITSSVLDEIMSQMKHCYGGSVLMVRLEEFFGKIHKYVSEAESMRFIIL